MNTLFGLDSLADVHVSSLLKLWPVRVVLVGWIVIVGSIAVSYAQTGNFLFEYGPDSGRPEIVTPYFKVVAISFFAQFIVIGAGLVLLRLKLKKQT
jgi:hypothetical protein